MLNRDDRVVYVGRKWAKELSGKIGYVIAPVQKEKDVFVVEFGEHAYIMPVKSLDHYRPSGKDDDAPEVHIRRRPKSEDDE